MKLESQAALWRRFVAIAGMFVGIVLLTPMMAAPAVGQDKGKLEAKPNDGEFFNVDGAKDCAYDESRHRLYVTTPEQLVVVDTKEGKVLPGIDLPGSLPIVVLPRSPKGASVPDRSKSTISSRRN